MKRQSLAIVLFALLLLVPWIVSSQYFLNVLIVAGIWVVLAASINLMLGYAGQLPLGHTAFYGLGAYVSALLNIRLGLPIWLCMPAAALFSMLVGYALGRLTFRVRGSAFVLVTLGFGELMRLLANNWMSLTNGPLGLSGIAAPSLFGQPFGYRQYYYLILAICVCTIYVIWRLIHSRFGRAFVAINENEALARAVGVRGERFLVLAMMVSTLFAGAAGCILRSLRTVYQSGPLLLFQHGDHDCDGHRGRQADDLGARGGGDHLHPAPGIPTLHGKLSDADLRLHPDVLHSLHEERHRPGHGESAVPTGREKR